MRLPYLPWMPRKYNNNFPFSDLGQARNILLNSMERMANRDTLRSWPLVIQAEVTKRCNINCFMCLRDNVKSEDMSPDVVESLIPLSRHTNEMQLYGYGEPLISKAFYSLISRLECAKLTFTTNGLTLSPELLQKILSGARRPVYCISFSIDGATPETYESIREGASFHRVVDNLASIDTYRRKQRSKLPKTEILFLAMNKNIRELPDLVRLAARLGVSTVQVAHIIVWDEINKEESLLYHPDEMKHFFAEAARAASALNIELGLPALITLNGDGKHGKASAAVPKCYWPWRHPVVKYNGDVQPCCAAPDVVLGNILDEPFPAIWNGPGFRRFRRQVNSEHPPRVCRTCDIRFRDLSSLDQIERVYIRPPPENR